MAMEILSWQSSSLTVVCVNACPSSFKREMESATINYQRGLMRMLGWGGSAMSEAYRADHVGSFLRPAELKEARVAFREGRLPLEQLRQIEDRAILAAIERQRSVGVNVFTDGE